MKLPDDPSMGKRFALSLGQGLGKDFTGQLRWKNPTEKLRWGCPQFLLFADGNT